MNQAAFFVFQVLKSKVYVFQTKDNGLCRQKVRLNPSLVLYSGNCEFKHAHQLRAELSTSFVWMVSVPRGDQSKSNIAFEDSYLY